VQNLRYLNPRALNFQHIAAGMLLGRTLLTLVSNKIGPVTAAV